MKNIFLIITAIFLGLGVSGVTTAQEVTLLSSAQEINYKNFSKVDISGAWDVNIKSGSKYKIMVSTSQELKKYVDLNKEEDTLYLKIKTRPWTWFRKTSERVYAEITVPTLTKIEASGDSGINFNGFNVDIFNIDVSGQTKITCGDNKITNLFIETSGDSSITCKDSKIENLSIESSGSSGLDFNKSMVKNANIYLSGSSKAELTMQGGSLSGRLDGKSSLSYSGKVKIQDISTTGSSNIVKK